MTRFSTVVATAALAFGAVTSASAALITEVEFNSSLAGAQVIPVNSFTLPAPGTVFPLGFPTATISGQGGEGDVDFYAFTASGGQAYFDIDDVADINDSPAIETILSLFDSAGTLIALGDNSDPKDPGSASFSDAFLGVFSLPGPGTYYLAVSAFPNFPTGLNLNVTLQPLTRPDGVTDIASPFRNNEVIGATPGDSGFLEGVSGSGTAPYTLHISVQNPGTDTVPEPVTLLLFGAGLTAAAVRMRRR